MSDSQPPIAPTDPVLEAVPARPTGFTPMPGLEIDGRYQLIRPIGEGGMGQVYLATQLQMNRTVVLKILKPELCINEDQVKRFRREAELASQLTHPNSVITHDFNIFNDVPYIVMEALEGQPLSEKLHHEKILSLKETCSILEQICSSLKEAHDKGMVHRDLKPENIFILSDLSRAYNVKVLDFGIAKLVHDHPNAKSSNLTRGDVIFGTPQFMSPEQIRGKEIDCRADIYALGVMLFQSLTGKLPYDSETIVDILTQHLTLPIPKITADDCPALSEQTINSLNDLIKSSMAKRATQRLSTVDLFSDFLRNIYTTSNLERGEATEGEHITEPTEEPPPTLNDKGYDERMNEIRETDNEQSPVELKAKTSLFKRLIKVAILGAFLAYALPPSPYSPYPALSDDGWGQWVPAPVGRWTRSAVSWGKRAKVWALSELDTQDVSHEDSEWIKTQFTETSEIPTVGESTVEPTSSPRAEGTPSKEGGSKSAPNAKDIKASDIDPSGASKELPKDVETTSAQEPKRDTTKRPTKTRLGFLKVHSKLDSVSIYIDDEYKGDTPKMMVVRAGQPLTIRCEKDKKHTETQITVTPKTRRTVQCIFKD